MANCIATGEDWMGHVIPKSGPVFYITGEGIKGMKKRRKAWAKSRGIDPDTIPVFYSSVAAQLIVDESLNDVLAAIRTLVAVHGIPRAIVIDTLNRNIGSGNENDGVDITKFVNAMDKIRNDLCGCAVIVVHHTAHSTTARPRGSGILHNAMDFEYSVSGLKGTRTLTCTKNRENAVELVIHFDLEVIDTGWTDPGTGQPITSCVPKRVDGTPGRIKSLNADRSLVLEALALSCVGKVHASKKDWKAKALEIGLAGTRTPNTTDKAFTNAFKYLTDGGCYAVESDKADHFMVTTQAIDMVKSGNIANIHGKFLNLPGKIAEGKEHPPIGVPLSGFLSDYGSWDAGVRA